MLVSRKGFTIVELLVVVTIMSILAAMLLPVLSTAMESARRTSCASSQKQIGLSLHLYADENKGKYPVGGYYAYGGISRWSWDFGQTTVYTRLTQLLELDTRTKNNVPRRHSGYLPDYKVLICPSSHDVIPHLADNQYDPASYAALTDVMNSRFLNRITYLYWANEVGGNPKNPKRPHPTGPRDSKYGNTILTTDIVSEVRVPWTSHMDKAGGGGNVLRNGGDVKWVSRRRHTGGPAIAWTSKYGFVSYHWPEVWE